MKLSKKKSGIYVLDYDVGGKRKRVSLNTRDHDEAKDKARKIVLGVIEPSTVTPRQARPNEVTIEQLLEHTRRTHWRESKSQHTVNSNIRILTRMVGQTAVSRVDSNFMVALRERFEAEGSKPATIKRKLDCLYRALRVALHWDGGSGTGIPVLDRLPQRPAIRVENYKDRVVSPTEQVALFAAVDKRMAKEPTRDWHRFKVLLRFLLDTGCRLSEALNVVVEGEEAHIDVRGDVSFVLFPRYTTKNGKPRSLPLTPGLVEEINSIKGRAINGKLFPLRAATAWYYWKGLRSDLGESWNNVTLHTFRHTCLTELAKKLPIHKVSLWAGHSDIKITMDRYAHLQSEDLLDCLGALSAR